MAKFPASLHVGYCITVEFIWLVNVASNHKGKEGRKGGEVRGREGEGGGGEEGRGTEGEGEGRGREGKGGEGE